jgi:hypothetical protein
MLRIGHDARRRRLLQLTDMYFKLDDMYSRKPRSFAIHPDHRGRQSSAMKTFETYRKSAAEGDEANFRRFIRLPLRKFAELLAKVKPRLMHANTHSDPIDEETRLVLALRYECNNFLVLYHPNIS